MGTPFSSSKYHKEKWYENPRLLPKLSPISITHPVHFPPHLALHFTGQLSPSIRLAAVASIGDE